MPESVVKEQPSGMRVWLVHKGSSALAEIVRPSPNDSTKLIVKLQHSDREIEVGQNDVEKVIESKINGFFFLNTYIVVILISNLYGTSV